MAQSQKRILVVASSGGHWVQLLRLRPVWQGLDVAYLTTNKGYRSILLADARAQGEGEPRFYTVVAANRWQKIRLIRQLLGIVWVLLRERPDAVLTTGAAPGFFALQLGRWMGAKTVWIDSIANAEVLSLSGQKAQRCAELWLTQWPHLADERKGPRYLGSVV